MKYIIIEGEFLLPNSMDCKFRNWYLPPQTPQYKKIQYINKELFLLCSICMCKSSSFDQFLDVKLTEVDFNTGEATSLV